MTPELIQLQVGGDLVDRVFRSRPHRHHCATPGLNLRPPRILYDGRDQPQRPRGRHDGQEVVLALRLDRDLALTLPLPSAVTLANHDSTRFFIRLWMIFRVFHFGSCYIDCLLLFFGANPSGK